MSTIYHNNDVLIETEVANFAERKVQVNGENLIWISSEDEESFKQELRDLLDKYRI